MSGAVITDGAYHIPTEQGLPVGGYHVRIFAADESADSVEVPGESNKLSAERIPPEFNTETKQSVNVSADGNNVFDFSIPSEI